MSQRRFAAGRLLQWGNTLQWAGASSEARRATGSCHCEEEPRGLGCSVWTSGAQTALGTPGVQPHRLGVAWLAPGKSNCASLLFRHSPDLPTWKEGWRGLPATCSHSAHKSVTVEGPPFKKQLLRRAVSRQPLDTGFQRPPPGPSRRPSHWWDGAPPTGARPVADRACCLALGLSQALPPPPLGLPPCELHLRISPQTRAERAPPRGEQGCLLHLVCFPGSFCPNKWLSLSLMTLEP